MTGIGDDIKQPYVGGICLCVCVCAVDQCAACGCVCMRASIRILKTKWRRTYHRACINYCQQSHLMINHRSYSELNVYQRNLFDALSSFISKTLWKRIPITFTLVSNLTSSRSRANYIFLATFSSLLFTSKCQKDRVV